MQNLKTFVAIVLGVLLFLITTSLWPQQTANANANKGPRGFYLTTTTHTGDQALAACAAGFHMASLWEILDPSNLRYEPTPGSGTGRMIGRGFGTVLRQCSPGKRRRRSSTLPEIGVESRICKDGM